MTAARAGAGVGVLVCAACCWLRFPPRCYLPRSLCRCNKYTHRSKLQAHPRCTHPHCTLATHKARLHTTKAGRRHGAGRGRPSGPRDCQEPPKPKTQFHPLTHMYSTPCPPGTPPRSPPARIALHHGRDGEVAKRFPPPPGTAIGSHPVCQAVLAIQEPEAIGFRREAGGDPEGRPVAQAGWPVSGERSSDGNASPAKTALPARRVTRHQRSRGADLARHGTAERHGEIVHCTLEESPPRGRARPCSRISKPVEERKGGRATVRMSHTTCRGMGPRHGDQHERARAGPAPYFWRRLLECMRVPVHSSVTTCIMWTMVHKAVICAAAAALAESASACSARSYTKEDKHQNRISSESRGLCSHSSHAGAQLQFDHDLGDLECRPGR